MAEHAARCGPDPSDLSESDFRLLRGAALIDEGPDAPAQLARVIQDARTADYAEWPGWLAPIVDRIVLSPASGPLIAALAALDVGGSMRQTLPVLAQARRLAAHIAARAADHSRAFETWTSAESLARECGLAFEAAVIALERAEHALLCGLDADPSVQAETHATFARLSAEPWLVRAERAAADGRHIGRAHE